MKVGGKEGKGMDLRCNMSEMVGVRTWSEFRKSPAYSDIAHARPNPSYVDVPSASGE